jgi:hypothetical protein
VHSHPSPITDPTACKLEVPVGSTCITKQGKIGKCTVIRPKYCACQPDQLPQPGGNIALMYDDMQAAVATKEGFRELGTEAACAEFQTVFREFLTAKSALMASGIDVYEAKRLGELDYIIQNYRKTAGFASMKCGLDLPIDVVLEALRRFKVEVSAAYDANLPSQIPVPSEPQ